MDSLEGFGKRPRGFESQPAPLTARGIEGLREGTAVYIHYNRAPVEKGMGKSVGRWHLVCVGVGWR